MASISNYTPNYEKRCDWLGALFAILYQMRKKEQLIQQIFQIINKNSCDINVVRNITVNTTTSTHNAHTRKGGGGGGEFNSKGQ